MNVQNKQIQRMDILNHFTSISWRRLSKFSSVYLFKIIRKSSGTRIIMLEFPDCYQQIQRFHQHYREFRANLCLYRVSVLAECILAIFFVGIPRSDWAILLTARIFCPKILFPDRRFVLLSFPLVFLTRACAAF